MRVARQLLHSARERIGVMHFWECVKTSTYMSSSSETEEPCLSEQGVKFEGNYMECANKPCINQGEEIKDMYTCSAQRSM